MSAKTGHYAIMEQFAADGLTHIFGNPGTSEEGFLDALEDFPKLKYVLALQESVAVLAADGYARASGRPTVVQIHSTPGLGNAIGALYQAHRGHSPLVVIGGDGGIRYQPLEAQMYGDLVAMAAPVTKWSTMVKDRASVLRVLRRAIKVAATPPTGPVYVCLPLDLLDAPCTEAVWPTLIPSTRSAPDGAAVSEASELLAAAERPVVIVGDGIAFSGAQPELAAVAELLGAEIWAADAGELNMPLDHPLYQGMTGHMFGRDSLPVTSGADSLLVCGTYLLPEVFPELGDIFAPGAKVVHIDLDAGNIGKNHPVDLGLVADPKRALGLLADQLRARLTPVQREAARRRADASGRRKRDRRERELARDREVRDRMPLPFSRFMEELAAQLPPGAIVFDEALTNSPAVTRYFQAREPGQYLLTRGGSLGVGLPGAVGVKLARPDRTVVGISGDGGAMYTIQALWTALRHDVAAKFVICNNRSYRLLQANLSVFRQERGIAARSYPLSFDLSEPPLRFDRMAQALGVGAARVERPDEVAPAIRQMLTHPGPFLIDVALEGDVHPELVGVRCGQ
jgi:thiamine pyrophosphate-dependent acetolactate synthase large subunit-like protein